MNLNPNDLPEHIKRINPQLFRPIQTAQLQPDSGRALDGQAPQKKSGRGRVARGGPVLRVSLISCRHRTLSDPSDNGRTGYKELRDAIARFFGLDDEDGTIAWEYGQHETRGTEGTVVTIQLL